jgi:hypothetical protein
MNGNLGLKLCVRESFWFLPFSCKGNTVFLGLFFPPICFLTGVESDFVWGSPVCPRCSAGPWTCLFADKTCESQNIQGLGLLTSALGGDFRATLHWGWVWFWLKDFPDCLMSSFLDFNSGCTYFIQEFRSVYQRELRISAPLCGHKWPSAAGSWSGPLGPQRISFLCLSGKLSLVSPFFTPAGF